MQNIAKNHKFDTKVQHLKYKVLREVARQAFQNNLAQSLQEIPQIVVPGNVATMRCCVYKERAILIERIRLAMGGDKSKSNEVEVINIACDECPVGGYEVSEACRGCIAHRCEEVCPKNAISFDQNQKASIDKSACIECGKCANICPFNAISNNKRPCEVSCKVKAISMAEDKSALIDSGKCISCGACVYHCPFGAIMDKSYILEVVDLINKSKDNKNFPLFAVVAPSIGSQFSYAKTGQVISGMKDLGFFRVYEAAFGADITAYNEALELYNSKLNFMTSSCCPAFVDYIKKQFPKIVPHISHNLSPMAETAKYIKENYIDAKVVFIGPCIAKKAEAKLDSVKEYIDAVITFEELQALFDSRDIDISSLESEDLKDSSFFGRIFARSGGVSEAVKQALIEHGLEDFDYRPLPCDGIDECRKALLKLKSGMNIGNFIEGMACAGGCISGAGCLKHGEKDKKIADVYASESEKTTISAALAELPKNPQFF